MVCRSSLPPDGTYNSSRLNGSEFTSRELETWAYLNDVKRQLSIFRGKEQAARGRSPWFELCCVNSQGHGSRPF